MAQDRGCGCSKPKPKPGSGSSDGKTQSFALIQGGRTQTFGSALERDAAWVRSGRIGDRQP